jgi:hypothetical protein
VLARSGASAAIGIDGGRYTRAVPLSPSAAARLAAQLECLADVLGSATDEALHRKTRTGKWSAHDNLAHLARHHAIFLERVRQILTTDTPALDRYVPEEDREWPAWNALPTAEVLARLRAQRQEIIATLTTLPDEALARPGRHPVVGVMPLSEWTEFFLVHEGHHLYVIFKRVRGGE